MPGNDYYMLDHHEVNNMATSSPAHDTRYSVYLGSKLLPGFTLQRTVILLQTHAKLSNESIKKLFSKKNSIIKSNLTKSSSKKLVDILTQCGLDCTIQKNEINSAIKTHNEIIKESMTGKKYYGIENKTIAQAATALDHALININPKITTMLTHAPIEGIKSLTGALMKKDEKLVTSDSEIQKFKKLSNGTFFKWFALINIALIITFSMLTGLSYRLYVFIFTIGVIAPVCMLFFSKHFATKVHELIFIMPNHYRMPQEKFLYDTIKELSIKASLPKIPEVAYYISPDMNAFATGYSRSNALVAFSATLIDEMTEDQLRAVAAHEIAHIANLDMIGTTLIQGMINSIYYVISTPIRMVISIHRRTHNLIVEVRPAHQGHDPLPHLTNWLLVWIHRIFSKIIFVLGDLLANLYSRKREYRADEMASLLVGPESMISALSKLRMEVFRPPPSQIAYSAFKISNARAFHELFSTHPLVEKRILAIENKFDVPPPD